MMQTRQAVMNDPTVHYLVKNVLRLTEDKDVLDRYYDVKLALDVLKAELDEIIPNGTL